MAKYECRMQANFEGVLAAIENDILRGSMSASYEDGSDYCVGNVRCAVRVFERYSMVGGNRVSLSVTLIGQGSDLYLSAITAGGSQATFFKVNTLGEEAFLDRLIDAVQRFYPTE